MPQALTFRTLIICLLALLATACSSQPSGNSLQHSSESAQTLGFQLPEIASLPDRQTLDSRGYLLGQNLSEDLQRQWVSSFDGTQRFTPAESGPPLKDKVAWAIYRLPMREGGPLSWTPSWFSAPPAGNAYVALANYETGRWDWQRLADPAATVEFGDSAPYTTPELTAYLAILIIPGSGSPELDHFVLETKPGSGWRFVELLSEMIPEPNVFTTTPLSPAVVNGKPALLYSRGDAGGNYSTYLAVSATQLGTDFSDWTIHALPQTTTGTYADELVEIGNGYALLGDSPTDDLMATDIIYRYSTDPAGPYSSEVVDTRVGLTVARPGNIGGLPGVAYSAQEAGPSETTPVYYAGADAPAGGSWSITQLPDALITPALSDGLPSPGAVDGKPVLGFYSLEPGNNSFTVYSAAQALPTIAGDWTKVVLGGGSNNRQFQTYMNGQLVFGSCSITTDAPFNVTLFSYRLTGPDPGNMADWLRIDLANLDFGPYPIVALLGTGSELGLLQIKQVDQIPVLDGSITTLRYWHSSDPQDLPANWQAEIVADDLPQSNLPAGISRMILVNGQPAFAQYFRLRQGFPGEERTWTKLVWCVYVP